MPLLTKERMRIPLRKLSLLAVAAAVALSAAADASAANIAPNPSFQDACGSPTKACYWHEGNHGAFSFQRDSSLGRTDSASYRFLADETSLVSGAGIPSSCLQMPLAEGAGVLAFWYRTTDTDLEYVSFDIFFHSQPGCNSFQTRTAITATPPTPDGEWHRVTGTFQAPASGSWFVSLGFGCQMSCGASQLNWDDLVVEQNPTAVTVGSIQGRRTSQGALLRWHSTQETDLLGFNLYRQQKDRLVKVNRTLIPSVFGGTTSGNTYSWLDRTAPRQRAAIRYRLQSIGLDRSRSWVGAAAVAG